VKSRLWKGKSPYLLEFNVLFYMGLLKLLQKIDSALFSVSQLGQRLVGIVLDNVG